MLSFSAGTFGARVVRMTLSPIHRSLIAWALYFCVLFNVISCGLGHGQALGLALNGIDGGFCSLNSDTSTLQAKQDGAFTATDWSNRFTCPMCTAAFLVLVFLIGVAWLMACAGRSSFARERRGQAPPRYCWPSSNPRASPL